MLGGQQSRADLGNGPGTTAVTPQPVVGLPSGVTSVGVGNFFACALTAAGAVDCWGENDGGQLGDGLSTDSASPVAVSGLSSGVTALSVGDNTSCALTTGGAVVCWGVGTQGQLGNGSNASSTVPVPVTGLSAGVTAIGAGGQVNCAVTASGGAKCWGRNIEGELGNGTTTDSSTPVDVSGLTSGIASVSAAGNQACALTLGGGMKCWGWDGYGQNGNGTLAQAQKTPVDVNGLTSGVAAITSGDEGQNCAVTTAGAAQCWGDDLLGPARRPRRRPEQTTPVSVTGLSSGVASIAAGGWHTCALTTAGGVLCWGASANNQLGFLNPTWYPSDVSGNHVFGAGLVHVR